MYTFSNQTTIECCLSISICFLLLFCQSITSQTSITFLFVLNYEFPLVFLFPFVFAIPFIPLPFPFPTIPDPIPFPMIKCGYGIRRGVFPSVSVRFHPYRGGEVGRPRAGLRGWWRWPGGARGRDEPRGGMGAGCWAGFFFIFHFFFIFTI
jgi:hypothetical protein